MPQDLSLGSSLSSADVTVSNVGGGTLNVTSATTAQGWISVSPTAGGEGTYEITVTARNEGSQAARNLKVWSAFSTEKPGTAYSQHVTRPTTVQPGEEIAIVVTLPVPKHVKTRIQAAVFGDNFIRRGIQSEWMQTD